MIQLTVVARKRPRDSSSDRENEGLPSIIKKNFMKKTRAIILQTDSEAEEDDRQSTGANCDSGTRKQIQSTEMIDEKGKAGDYLMHVFIPICTY